MKRALNEDLIFEVLSVVEEIPEGNVAKNQVVCDFSQ